MLSHPGYREFPFPGRAPTRSAETLWSFLADQPGEYRVLPDGRVDLMVRFHLHGSLLTRQQLIIAGPAERYFLTPIESGCGFIGVRFRAGWGPACLQLSGAWLRNRVLHTADALDCIGEAATTLLQASEIGEMRAGLVALVARMTTKAARDLDGSRVIAALDLLHLSGGRIAVAEIARLVGTPERSLRRAVLDAAGLPLKTLGAILRFQRTVRLLQSNPPLSLADAAFEGGYTDQSHMTRDFMRLGGFTPGRMPQMTLVTMERLAS